MKAPSTILASMYVFEKMYEMDYLYVEDLSWLMCLWHDTMPEKLESKYSAAQHWLLVPVVDWR